MANKLDQYTVPIDGDTTAEPQNQATPDGIDARAAIVPHKNALERMADYAERFKNMPTAACCGENFTQFAKKMPPRGLCFVGGDPGSGKTSFLLNIAAGRIAAGKPTIMLTLEMSAPEILQRLAAIVQKKPANSVHSIDGFKKASFMAKLILIEPTDCDADGAAIFDADTLAADVADLRAKCGDQNADIMLIVDSLNMLETPSANDERRAVNINIRALSRFAKANNVTTMCIAQSNRETTKDNAKKYFADFADADAPGEYNFTPLLSAFRESSLIEYIADCVFYVLKETADPRDQTEVERQIVTVKHRTQPPNSHVKLKFNRPTFTFKEYDN